MSRFITVCVIEGNTKKNFAVDLKKKCFDELKQEIFARTTEKKINEMYYRGE